MLLSATAAMRGGNVLETVFNSEGCMFKGLFGCSSFAVFDKCLVLEIENLVERGVVVESVSVFSSSLTGECSFVQGQDGMSGVAGLGEVSRVVLSGPGCGFLDSGSGLNEYKINVSYSWESNRALGGSVSGRLLVNDPSGSGGGVCEGPCERRLRRCRRFLFRGGFQGFSCFR